MFSVFLPKGSGQHGFVGCDRLSQGLFRLLSYLSMFFPLSRPSVQIFKSFSLFWVSVYFHICFCFLSFLFMFIIMFRVVVIFCFLVLFVVLMFSCTYCVCYVSCCFSLCFFCLSDKQTLCLCSFRWADPLCRSCLTLRQKLTCRPARPNVAAWFSQLAR